MRQVRPGCEACGVKLVGYTANPAEQSRRVGIVAPAPLLPCCGPAASMLMNNPGSTCFQLAKPIPPQHHTCGDGCGSKHPSPFKKSAPVTSRRSPESPAGFIPLYNKESTNLDNSRDKSGPDARQAGRSWLDILRAPQNKAERVGIVAPAPLLPCFHVAARPHPC